MQFKSELVLKILSGRKSVTRRINPGHYRVGGIYAVQPGRGFPGVAKIKITDMRLEKLGDINRFEAIREGFGGDNPVHEFLEYWKRLHSEINLNREVWRIEFELVGVKNLPTAARSWMKIICEAGGELDEGVAEWDRLFDKYALQCDDCLEFYPDLSGFMAPIVIDFYNWDDAVLCLNCKMAREGGAFWA